MPRYFFRLTDGVNLEDFEGDVLANDDAARQAALEILAQTLDSRGAALLAGDPYVVEATEGEGRLVYRLTVEGVSG